ncbi:hypothetical protein Tco_1396869 [Tanacetum coccineum]
MRYSLLRSSPSLLLPHPLLTHQAMFLRDDGDDEDESSDDDEDDDVDIKGDKEEEEHPAPADSTVVALPAIDHAPSTEETDPFETDESTATSPPHLAYHFTARISIRDEPPTPFWSDTEVARLLVIPTPPPSPLSLWSSPLPQIPFPPLPSILSPLPVSPPLHVSSLTPASPIRPLGYRAAMIRLRAEALSTSHSLPLPPPIILSHTRSDAPSLGTPPLLPIPLPTSSPPLHLLSTDHRADTLEVTLPPRKRLGIVLGLRYEVGESSSAPTARPPKGFKDEMLVDMPGAPVIDDTELGRRMTEFTTRVRQDTNKIYTSDLARAEVMSLHTQVVAQQVVITELQAADRRRQAAITEMLAADHMRQAQFIEALKLLKRLQTYMTEFERQQGPAKGPTQPYAPEEAGSSS